MIRNTLTGFCTDSGRKRAECQCCIAEEFADERAGDESQTDRAFEAGYRWAITNLRMHQDEDGVVDYFKHAADWLEAKK